MTAWAAILGFLTLLLFGGLLALFAACLPRIFALLEGAESRVHLEDLPPRALREPEVGEPQVTPALAERPRPAVPPPISAVTATGPEEPLVAAAIALALALYQEETAALPPAARNSGGASPWSLMGRWQAMQTRLGVRKR